MTQDDFVLSCIFPLPQRVECAGGWVSSSVLDCIEQGVAPEQVVHAQGYRLTIDEGRCTLVGHDDAGLFYGLQTVAQLRRRCSDTVPCLTVEDWPDLSIRGYMLDVSRDRVPKMDTVKQLIDQLAQLKFNQLQLYTEHTIAYAGHEPVWRDASPFTFCELEEVQAYCNARFIDLVPCQNLFGHMTRWLIKPEYADLAETPDGWDTPWNFHDPLPFSLNPTDPRSFALSADLIDQLAPASSSKLFNIGCDETTDIGQGKSKAVVEEVGRAAVYLDYLKKLCARVAEHGMSPMFWGDIVISHPELVSEIPDNAVLLNWNYESPKSFKEESKQFRDAGVRFYVCPGTSSWCTLSGRGQNAIDNMRDAAEAAIAYGAEGYLLTDWGDHGHWQPFATSWVGITYGAGVAWACEKNKDAHNSEVLSLAVSYIAADEKAGDLGTILWALANVYLGSKAKFVNQTWWFRYLKSPEDSFEIAPWDQLTLQDVRNVIAALDGVQDMLDRYQPTGDEATRLKQEAQWCVAISRWACTRVEHVLDSTCESEAEAIKASADFDRLVDEFQTQWLKRYRPGGLVDSVEKLTLWCRLNDERTHAKSPVT